MSLRLLVWLDSDAGIAQLVEQLICNQQVGGSSPSTGSTLCYSEALRSEYGGIPEWPKGADCKSVSSAFGGSNPPSPTIKRVRKRCTPQKARFYRAFLLPESRFSERQNRRCKIGFFPLKIDTNSSNNRIQNKNGR